VNTSLKEYDFFRFTDHVKEADQVKKYRFLPQAMLTSGTALTITGLLMIIYNKTKMVENKSLGGLFPETEHPLLYPGIAVVSVGVGAGLFGVFKLSKNWASFAFARDIADEYNGPLRLEIQQP